MPDDETDDKFFQDLENSYLYERGRAEEAEAQVRELQDDLLTLNVMDSALAQYLETRGALSGTEEYWLREFREWCRRRVKREEE